MQRHSTKAITVRSDARHCNRRRTHQTHMHNININNNNNSSRATHLPAGCDIQRRNRLSSSPFRINSCSCKSLVAKHQSDTSLSCKTPNSNDIISLDSTDDEDDSLESARESTEKSSMIIEKRNQSTQQRIVRRVRPPLQPQTVDNRQTNTNTITQRTKPCQAHALRHNRQLRPKKVDTIVLDSSSSDGEETRSAPVNADEVNKHKIDQIDDTRIEEPNTPTAQPQQTQQQQQQQAARAARLQSVSMPLRCALIGSVAIKPIRKEKHCIPGEVSSTTSHDINETERLNEVPAVSCSANLLVHNASAYENAREVGTVEILERRELRQPVVMSAERCFQPGKLLLGIDYSDDENEDDAAARSRENIAVGSEVGDDDDDAVSNGCIIPMVGGYSKVVEEATSSTEVFQRIQSLENLENVAATEALSIVEPAPMVLAGLVERTAHVAAVSEDAPTCSKYANSNATVSKEGIQKECASASAHTLELKRGKSLKITVKDFASANIIGRGKDMPEERLREDMESAAPAFGLLAGLGHEDVQQQVNDKNEDETGIKTIPLLAEEPTAINKDKHEIPTELTDSAVKNNAAHLLSEDNEMAAIDQMLADIDENLRVSHEFNEKYMKAKKNTAGVQSHNVAVQLTEHVQNELDLTNTAVHNLDKNAIPGNCEQIERTAPAKTALTHTNDKALFLDVCAPVPELAKSSDADTEVETSVPVMETNAGELISVKPMKKLTTVERQSLERTNNTNTKETEEVNTMVRAESECLYKNNAAFEENSSYLVAACATKISKSTQNSCEEEAMVGNVQNNEEIESNQESDVLNDSCSRAVKTLAHLADNAQTNSRSEGNTETEKRQLRDEDTTETDGLEKNTHVITDLQAKSIETDLNKSSLNEMNAEVEVQEIDISTEVNAEERVNDMEVLVKPFEDVVNGTALTLSVKNISGQIDMDQTEAAEMTVFNTNITTNINKEIFEVENTNCDSQESTELVSCKTQANFVTTDLDTELAVSIERAENVDDNVHNLMKVSDISNDENVITNKNAEAEKCEVITGMVLESRTVVDDTKNVDKYDSSKTREESEVSTACRHTENCNIENIEGYITSADAVNCAESESIDKSTKTTSPKTILKDSDKCNELAFVENIENLLTDVTESFSEPSTPTEFVGGNEMVSIDDIETLGMCKPVAIDIAEETVVTMKDVTETENETVATPLLENATTEEILSTAKEMRTVEPEPTVIETLALDLKRRDIEHHDSISRNIDEESVNKEELTKQSRRLVSCFEVASEMVEPLTLPTKDNGSKTHKKALATSNSVEELVKDTEQYNDETSLLESSTIIQVNERQAAETESTDIETPMLVVKSQVMECHEVSDSVTRSNEEEPGNVIQLSNENDVETETEPLETEGKINNSHEVSDLITNKIEELTVVTEEIVKAESHDETDETSLLESVTKFQVNERSSASADIKNKSPLQLKDVECAEVSDSASHNKGEQKVLVTDPRISNQDLPESVCIKIKEGFESSDVKTLPITHEIIVSAAKEIEEVVEEEIIEQLVETEDQLRVAQQEIGNNAENSTEVTSETSGPEITTELTAVTSVVPDDSIEETPSNRDDSLEGVQFTELNDSQTEELDDGNASNKSLNTLMKNSSEHTTNVQTEIHESRKCKIPLGNDFLHSEDEATDETPSEFEVKPDETNESSVIGTEVVETSAGEEITLSVAADVVEASICSQEIASNECKQSIESQLEAVSEIENSQKIIGSTIEPEEQEQLEEINSDETSVDSTEKFATECKVLPTETNNEDSDQNANISEEKLKVIVATSELEVKEIPKERPSNNDVSESCAFSTGDKQVDETSSLQDLQVDEENIDNSTINENEVVSLAEVEESVEEAAKTDAIVQAEVKELAITEDVPLEESAEEPCLTAQNESDTSKVPVILTKTQNAEEKQVEIELNDENNSNLKDLKSDDVAECEHEAADTNSLNHNSTNTVAVDTLLVDATARQLPSDSETVKTCSKQKLKLKSKPHKFIKIDLLEKSTTSGSKKTSKLKVVRNSKKRLLTEDASGKLRFKRRVSPSNDSNKDLDKVEELKKAEELADNIAKLVIKENVEVVENTIKQDNVTADTTEQSCSIKQDIDDRSLEDNTEITENQILDDINADETEQEMLEAEPELSEDCNSFQRLPSEYNSEEILAVTTLINMRNKYTSSTYMDEDNVIVEVTQEINRDEGTENIKAIVAPGSKKNITKVGLVKKKVRFDEDNLLELMNEKYKALKKVKKSAKKVEKSRKAEGALLSGADDGKKYVKRRLLELTTNLSTNEADHVIEHIEEVSDLKKKRGRKSSISAHEEQQLTHKQDELNDALKNESAVNNNPIYPVLLTSRRKSETTADTKPSKSTKNNTRSLKCDAPTISDIEYVGSDFIVPDDEVEPLCTETYEKPPVSKEKILKVSRVCVDGTKIKIKITPKEAIKDKEKPIIFEKRQEPETSVINKAEKYAIKEKISEQAALMKTRKVTVKLKRMKMPPYATAIAKGSTFSSGAQSATLTDSEELDTILPESPTKFSKREESPTKYKKREEPRVILLESPTQSKKREDLDTILPESPTKYKKREEAKPILTESPTKSKKREELVTVLPESPTKFNKREESPTKYKKREEPEPNISESATKSKKREELVTVLPESLTKFNKREEQEPFVTESPTKYKKPKLETDIGSSELNVTISDEVFIGTGNLSSKSLGKTSHRKHRANSPTKNKKSVKRDITSELAELLTIQDTDNVGRHLNAEPTNITDVSNDKLSPIKEWTLKSTSLENTGVVENANSLKNQDSSTKKTVKSAHKNRLAKTPIEEISPIKDLSFQSTSLENTAVVENANSLKNQDSSTKITVKSAHKNRLAKTPIVEISPNQDLSLESTSLENTGVADADPLQTQNSSDITTVKHKQRLAKSSSKTKSLVLPTTCEDVPTSKEALNKESTTIRAAAMEKTTCMNKISTIEDVTNVPTPELSLSKYSPLAEPSSNKESNVSPEQSVNMGVEKTKDSSTNITTKTSRKNRVVKSSFNIKLPIPSLTTKRASKIKEEPTVKDSTITTTKIDTSIDETPIPKESTNKREPALQQASTTKQLRAAQQKLQLERLDGYHEEFKVANLSAEAVRITSETTTGLQEHILSEAEIKTEPLEDIHIKEEEDSCEAPLDMAQSYLNVGNRRHAKEFILKPCDVILTEAKINEQADAHRVFRKLRNKKTASIRVVENTVPSTTNCNRFKARRNKASTTDVLKSAENVKTTENVMPTLEEVAQIKAMEEESNEQEMPKVQKELQTETIVEEMEKSKELQAETTKDDKKRSKVLQAETRKDDKKRSKVLQAETIVEDMEKSKEMQAETTKDDKKRSKVLQAETRKDDKKRSKVPQAETIVEDMEESKEMQADTTKDDKKRSKVLQAETRKDDKVENKDVNNSQTAVTVDNAIQQNSKPSKTDVEIEDHACSITDNVIAELKLLSPESLQNTEDDKEQIDLISCAENAAVGTVVDTVKEQETQLTTESMCKVEKTDEEQKTALLLDSSIDIVLGNATFTKKPLTPKKNSESSTPETVDSNLLQNVTDSVAEVKKPDPNISANPPTKNRLDVLTAEKINSVLEKMLEQKNNLLRDNKNAATMDAHLRPAIRRQTNTEEEGLRKSSNRNSLNSVKQISAKVPDALFADDESESSNADDSTSDEQFFAPILSLDDLLIKKDEPIADITHSYTPTQEQVVQETDAGQSHDGLGTPNFTVELEVETTQASDENSQSANGNQKVDAQSEESGKCVASEELNAHLEETDANFSLSAIADISTIDIPSDLNINNEYPDLLDAMLFEQVRQSIDCMISGTNSAKKWSQDSFATTQAAVNFNKAETAVRTDAPPSAPITQENDVIATNDKTVTANEEGIGIGQETFLGTISSLDEVEVPTTGFDLVGSFTIADFLSDAGSDLFAFPELDKTQSRSNSFSAESNLCETPPPPAIDTADEETSNDKKDECSIQTPPNQNTNSVACDHSYNKDINEVEKQRTKVRKKSTSSNTSTATALQSTAKSAASSPLNNADMLHVFSRAKCLPKPFWKVKRTEEIKTSTPKKEELTSNTQNTQPQTPAVAVKRTITLSPITVKNAEEKQTVFSMPALELVIEQNAQEEEITATSSNSALPEAITNTETETLTNLNENISKIIDDVTLPSQSVIETVKADGLEEVMVPNSAECETQTPLTRPPKRTSTPIEITEVITIPAPLIVQPIIRIQSQTNRLERIDPALSSSQQAFPLITPESQPNLTDAPNVSQIEVNDISRPERDSTPTLDEPSKDDYELSTPNNSLIVEASTHTGKARQSATELDEPPAKRLCVENVNKVITTNDIFDMLKNEEKWQKEAQLAKSSTNTTKTTDLVNTKIVDSKPKQILKDLSETKASDEHFNTDAEASNNTDFISSKVENKCAQIEEDKKNSENSASNQQIVQKPVDITPIKQKYEKLSPSQEPILISKETLIALKQREHAAKNMSTIMITEHLEHLQPLSPESTSENSAIKIADIKSLGKKLQRSPARHVEESQEEKIAPITLKITKDLLSQPNQSDERQQLRTKAVQCKNSTTSTKLDASASSVTPVTPSADDHSSSARTNIVPSKKLKGSNASPVLSNASPCNAKSNIDTNHNKTQEITNTHSPSKPTEKEDVRNTPPIKSQINMKIKELPIAEVINRSETKNVSTCQTATVSPLTRVPPKSILAVEPTLLPQNANRYHPYQRTQTPPNTLNTHKSKVTPQRPQSRDSLPATPENATNKKRETPKSSDKTTPQRIASTVTTLPPLMQSRPTPSHQTAFGTPPTITDLASIKLTAEDEAEIARKLVAYRTTLPQAKTYGAHKENQRLVNLQEEKLRLEYAERATRRLRDTQRVKRKSQPETYESHYKKFAMHAARTEAPNSSNSSSSSRSSGSASVGAGHHQSRGKQYAQQHATRPRPHHEYVNKFGEIEKLVEKEKVAKDTESKRSVPLTASTAWEPKMPTGDELIELLCKTKKS